MNTNPSSFGRTAARILAKLLLVASTGLAGAVLGALYVRFFVPKTGMGWDQIADALGGVMIGGAIGLVAGFILSFRLTTRRSLLGVAAGLGLVAVIVVGLRLVNGRSTTSEPVATPTSPVSPTVDRPAISGDAAAEALTDPAATAAAPVATAPQSAE